jgi:hypothetical protein
MGSSTHCLTSAEAACQNGVLWVVTGAGVGAGRRQQCQGAHLETVAQHSWLHEMACGPAAWWVAVAAFAAVAAATGAAAVAGTLLVGQLRLLQPLWQLPGLPAQPTTQVHVVRKQHMSHMALRCSSKLAHI